MGRAPCCEKMGLKKGPWTKEEDLVLVAYINQHGHQNWRALPKKAGLLRCGKSCRLRWINYLRPDIKRGNFSKEEEDSIIHLHQVLGNRWSAIAAKLPGRTDNEIKNVWHTHLKKRLPHHVKQAIPVAETSTQAHQIETSAKSDLISMPESCGRIQCQPNSPSHSTSSLSSSSSLTDVSSSSSSSSITAATDPENSVDACLVTAENLRIHPNLDVDEDFSWLDDVVSTENSGKFSEEDGLSLPVLSPLHAMDYSSSFNNTLSTGGDIEFWSDLFTRAEESLQLPEF